MRSWARRFFRSRSSKVVLTGFGLSVAIGIAIIGSSEPTTIVVLDAQTESIRYRVRDPDMAAFRLFCTDLAGTDARRQLADGLFVPALGSEVEYRKAAEPDMVLPGEAVGITIFVRTPRSAQGKLDGTGNQLLHRDSSIIEKLPDRLTLVPRPDCLGRSTRLPIWGPASVGESIRAIPATTEGPRHIQKARISVYAIANTHWLLSCLLSAQPTLYRSVPDIELPFGARVEGGGWNPSGSHSTRRQDDPLGSSAWHGIVAIDPMVPTMAVTISTQARDIAVYMPGTTGEATKILPGRLSHYADDPNVRAGLAYVGAMIAAIAFLTFLFQVVFHRGEDMEGAQARPSGTENENSAKTSPGGRHAIDAAENGLKQVD